MCACVVLAMQVAGAWQQDGVYRLPCMLAAAQGPALAPAPLGTGLPGPIRPTGLAPVPAPGPRSPYDPIFNPIIARAPPGGAQLQSQYGTGANNGQGSGANNGYGSGSSSSGYTNMQTVSVNSNGAVTTYNTPAAAGGWR